MNSRVEQETVLYKEAENNHDGVSSNGPYMTTPSIGVADMLDCCSQGTRIDSALQPIVLKKPANLINWNGLPPLVRLKVTLSRFHYGVLRMSDNLTEYFIQSETSIL